MAAGDTPAGDLPSNAGAVIDTLRLGWSVAGPAAAQVTPGAWPRCVAERDGQQIGQGGSVCECRYNRGGSMVGRPPGWRWSCDILRSDGSGSGAPADLPADRRRAPLGLGDLPRSGLDPVDDLTGSDLLGRSYRP